MAAALKECDICGEMVERRKAGPHKSGHVRSAKAKYRYDGAGKHPLELVACETCGTERWARRGSRFCSARCSKLGVLNPQWKGDAAKPTSARLRSHTRYELDYCRRCGGTENLHRHHIDRDTYNNEPDNIEILCATCHGREHGGERQERGGE